MSVAIFSTPGRGVEKDLTMSSVRSRFAQFQLTEQQQALFFNPQLCSLTTRLTWLTCSELSDW
jgi:hypothetical protein